MSYQLYRNTTIGHTLQESLDELIQCGQITPQLALKVLLQFDKAVNTALASRVKNRVSFKFCRIQEDISWDNLLNRQSVNTEWKYEGHLNTYRFCDNVWTFVLTNVEFREMQDVVTVDKVKIVACDGKSEGK